MSATLTISIPDQVLARLRERADAAGTTPEAVVAMDLAVPIPQDDYGKIRRLAGSLKYAEPDAATRHHDLLGDALKDELKGLDD